MIIERRCFGDEIGKGSLILRMINSSKIVMQYQIVMSAIILNYMQNIGLGIYISVKSLRNFAGLVFSPGGLYSDREIVALTLV